jgi:integrase
VANRTSHDRLLKANAKTIARAIGRAAEGEGSPAEFRVEGARGLVLHVLPSGTATWYLHYDVRQGRRRLRRKYKIGRSDEVALAAAIQRAERLRTEIQAGADPAAERAAAASAITIAEMAEARLTSGPRLRASSERDFRDLLRRDILSAIGSLPAQEVTKQHVIDIVDAIAARGATRRADTARAMISSIFSYGVDRGLVRENPAAGLRNRHTNQPRDVVLSGDQLRVLWSALNSGDAIASVAMARILKLALLTGQRRAEIAATRISELDLESGDPTLIIARGRAKNHNAHRVPLSSQALAEFRQAVGEAGASGFVFPNPSGAGHIAPRSVSKAMERNREKFGLGDIRVHDIRRTVGSMMTRFGVPRDVRERVLNHGGKRSGSVTEAVYSWYDFASEKRAALELWAEALSCIVEGRRAEIEDYSSRLARLRGTSKVLVN